MSTDPHQPPQDDGFPHQPPAVPGYRLRVRIGAGGFGEVWLAEDTTLHELRAIKFVWRDVIEGARAFERELEGVKRLEPISREHPGLVDILGVGEAPDHQSFWTVMELADNAWELVGEQEANTDGAAPAPAPRPEEPPACTAAAGKPGVTRYSPRTLLNEVRRRGRLPVSTVLDYGVQLADAVASLHTATPPRLHRDVKPGNILFVHGQPKVGDFGLVILQGEARTQYGTPGFMPPEGAGRPEADVYGLGKTLYFMATGLPVERFPELPTAEIPAAELATWNRLNDVILRACAPEPDARYRNAGELLADLRRVREGKPPRRKARKPGLLTWSLGILALLGLVLAVLSRSPRERRNPMPGEQFAGPVLDTQTWQPGRSLVNDEPTNWVGENGTSNVWSRTEPCLTNHSLVLEAQVESTAGTNGGWHIGQHVWVDWLPDLRNTPERQIEIDLEAEAPHGSLRLFMGSGRNATNCNAYPQVGLVTWAGTPGSPLSRQQARVRIDLSPGTGYAVVSDPDVPDAAPEVRDLRHLPEWHLRIVVNAEAAAGMLRGRSKVTVHSVRQFEVIRRSALLGFVTNATSGLPMVGLLMTNRTTGDRCCTGIQGEYVLKARHGVNQLATLGSDCAIPPDQTPPNAPLQGLHRHDLAVHRTPPALGDGLNRLVLPAGATGPFCLSPHGTILAVRSASNHMVGIWEIDPGTGAARQIGECAGANGLAFAHGRLYGADTWEKRFLYAAQPDGSFLKGPELPTRFVAGLTHDGTNWWIAQFNRAHGAGFALFRWNPQIGLTNRIETELPITSPAWLKGRLWVLADHVAYEIAPEVALSTGRVDHRAILRRFTTPCETLASDGTSLWGSSPHRVALHRLYVP